MVSRWLWPGNRTLSEVASMMVTWWIVAFCAVTSMGCDNCARCCHKKLAGILSDSIASLCKKASNHHANLLLAWWLLAFLHSAYYYTLDPVNAPINTGICKYETNVNQIRLSSYQGIWTMDRWSLALMLDVSISQGPFTCKVFALSSPCMASLGRFQWQNDMKS